MISYPDHNKTIHQMKQTETKPAKDANQSRAQNEFFEAAIYLHTGFCGVRKIFESNNIWTLQTFPHISEQFRLDILVTPGALSARSVRPPPSSPPAAAVSHCPLTASGQQTRMTGVANTGHVTGRASAHAKLLASTRVCVGFFFFS